MKRTAQLMPLAEAQRKAKNHEGHETGETGDSGEQRTKTSGLTPQYLMSQSLANLGAPG